jgi:hypothetical protein
LKPRIRKPTQAVMREFFETNERDSADPNCIKCGAHVLPHKQVDHVNWHLKLTKTLEGKRDKV